MFQILDERRGSHHPPFSRPAAAPCWKSFVDHMARLQVWEFSTTGICRVDTRSQSDRGSCIEMAGEHLGIQLLLATQEAEQDDVP
jgi:hypothetical protein